MPIADVTLYPFAHGGVFDKEPEPNALDTTGNDVPTTGEHGDSLYEGS
jgi:hypothetical protein